MAIFFIFFLLLSFLVLAWARTAQARLKAELVSALEREREESMKLAFLSNEEGSLRRTILLLLREGDFSRIREELTREAENPLFHVDCLICSDSHWDASSQDEAMSSADRNCPVCGGDGLNVTPARALHKLSEENKILWTTLRMDEG